jgi:putative ABC transport system permease protein
MMRVSGLLPEDAAARADTIPEVAGCDPLLVALVPAEIDGEPRTVLAIGIGDGEAARPRFMETGSNRLAPGEAIVDAAFARRARLSVGDTLRLPDRGLRIAGLSRETNLLVTQYAFVRLPELQEILGMEGGVSFFLVRLKEGSDARLCARRLMDRVPGVAAYDSATFLENNQREITRGFLPVLRAAACIGLVIGCLVVALVTWTAVVEKRADFAVLAAIGAGEGVLSRVVIGQAIAAAVAGAIGGLAALACLERLLPFLAPEVSFRLDPLLAGVSIAGACVVAAAGASWPARLASRIPPMEALRR